MKNRERKHVTGRKCWCRAKRIKPWPKRERVLPGLLARGRQYMRVPIRGRFLTGFSRGSGCWIWKKLKNNRGYGVLWSAEKQGMVLAHRLAWELKNGLIPSGKEVCHSCDVRSCVRPSHLFIGSHAENMRDCAVKDRCSHGSRVPTSKLKEEYIPKILDALGRGETRTDIAPRFGVSRHTIGNVGSGKHWVRARVKVVVEG